MVQLLRTDLCSVKAAVVGQRWRTMAIVTDEVALQKVKQQRLVLTEHTEEGC